MCGKILGAGGGPGGEAGQPPGGPSNWRGSWGGPGRGGEGGLCPAETAWQECRRKGADRRTDDVLQCEVCLLAEQGCPFLNWKYW